MIQVKFQHDLGVRRGLSAGTDGCPHQFLCLARFVGDRRRKVKITIPLFKSNIVIQTLQLGMNGLQGDAWSWLVSA